MRFTSDRQRKAAFANMMNGPISGMNRVNFSSRSKEDQTYKLLEEVTYDGYWTCPECGNRMEPDAGRCRCGFKSPLVALGLADDTESVDKADVAKSSVSKSSLKSEVRDILDKAKFKANPYAQAYIDNLDAADQMGGDDGVRSQVLYIASNLRAKGDEQKAAKAKLIAIANDEDSDFSASRNTENAEEKSKDRVLGNEESDFFGELISSYTKEDAVEDGQQSIIGSIGKDKVYITSTIIDEFDNEDRQKVLVDRVKAALDISDPEDTDYMKLRVLEKDKLWVIKAADGITIIHPSDY